MESTPADNTRARARSNRAESSSSIEELGDATVVARAQIHAETASPAESPEVDRTLAILPHPTPPPAHRTLERATAHTDPPNPTPVDAGVGALLAAVQQLQATLVADSHARAAEARALAQRLAQVEQAQSSASTAAVPRTRVDSKRREHAARPREVRRDSDSSESSRPERASRASPRKRAPQPYADPEPANASHARTQVPAPPMTEAPMSIPMPSSYIAPAPHPPPIPNADSRSNAYSYPFLENLRIADSIPAAQRSPERVTEPAARPSALAHSHDAEQLDWDSADRETLLKAASRPRFIESSGVKIRSFLADAELFLTLCNRPRSRWAYFVLSWLGSEEAEKVRRSHVADSVADYEKFREGLTTIFGRFEFEGAFRAQLRSLKQSGAESVTAYAARTTDLCSRAYAEFATEAQLSLAVDHFIGGLADTSTREYLLRERARRPLEWMEVVRIAQASETARLSNAPLGAAAACDSSAIVGPDSSVCAPLSNLRDTSHVNISSSRAQTESRARITHAILAIGAITRQSRMFENMRARQRINRAPRTNRIAPRSPPNPAPRSRTRRCVLIAANPDIWPLTARPIRRKSPMLRVWRRWSLRSRLRKSQSADTIAVARTVAVADTRATRMFEFEVLERNRLCGIRCLAIFFARGDRFNPRSRRTRGHWLVLLDDERIAVRAASEQAANLFVRERCA